EQILKSLDIKEKARIYVFNKIDIAPKVDKVVLEETYREFHPVYISSLHKEGVTSLIETIVKTLTPVTR
ncbi:MAG: hypothetical protein Q7S61_00490, partial [bacterium]|nr:hypothetical protein [bacterium]